jgi:hypothetical protein
MAKKTETPIEIGTLDPEYGLSVQELREELELGVVEDKLNDGKLLLLFGAGVLVVVVMIFAAMEMYRYFDFKASYKAAVEAVYPDIQNLKASHQQELTTVGVIDADKQIYRIPIDSAFTLVLNEQNK